MYTIFIVRAHIRVRAYGRTHNFRRGNGSHELTRQQRNAIANYIAMAMPDGQQSIVRRAVMDALQPRPPPPPRQQEIQVQQLVQDVQEVVQDEQPEVEEPAQQN